MIHKVSTEKHPFKKIKKIGSIVFYLDENGIKRMATKERFKEILKEQSIWDTKF